MTVELARFSGHLFSGDAVAPDRVPDAWHRTRRSSSGELSSWRGEDCAGIPGREGAVDQRVGERSWVLGPIPEIVARLADMTRRFRTTLACIDTRFIAVSIFDGSAQPARLGTIRTSGIDVDTVPFGGAPWLPHHGGSPSPNTPPISPDAPVGASSESGDGHSGCSNGIVRY
jgi:hypothetical protein